MQKFPRIYELSPATGNGSRESKFSRAGFRGVRGVRARDDCRVHGTHRERIKSLRNTNGRRIDEWLFLQASEKFGSGTTAGNCLIRILVESVIHLNIKVKDKNRFIIADYNNEVIYCRRLLSARNQVD